MADISVLIDVIGAEDMVKATRTADRMRKEYTRLDQQFNKGKITAQQYSKGVRQVDAKVEELTRSSQSYTKAAMAQTKAINSTTAAMTRQNAAVGRGSNNMAEYDVATYRSTQNTKRFASVGLQQAGYQIGDFAVQLQGGTNAAVAFGQQGSQLLGIFGAFGAVMGAVLAVTTAIVAPMLDSADAGGKMADEFKNLKAQLDPISPLMDSITSAANFLKEAAFDAINAVLNNLDRLLVIGSTVAAFFVGKWVAAFVAARVATLSLSASLVVLKGALVRTGIGALVVAAGELIFRFTKLVKGAGSFGDALVLLKDVGVEVFDKIVAAFKLVPAAVRVGATQMDLWFTSALQSMLQGFQDLTWQVAEGLNNLFNTNLQGSRISALEGFGTGSIAKAISDLELDLGSAKASYEDLVSVITGPIESLNALREAMARADAEGKRINIRDWFGGSSGAEDGEEGSGGGKGGAGKLTDELTAAQERVQSLADTMKNSMSDAFMSMVEGTKSFKDSVRDMARAVIKQLFDILVVQRLVGSFDAQTGKGSGIVGSIMGLFANGAAFSGGRVTAFADGGVVSKPTMFPMANGAGLMGEAGPEAIMPLKRGKGGKLGVAAEGGSQGNVTIHQSFNFVANGDESVKRIIQQEAPKISAMTEKQIINSRRRGGSMKQAFG